MRLIGKRAIGWGRGSHGVLGGIYWTRQTPKPVVLRSPTGKDRTMTSQQQRPGEQDDDRREDDDKRGGGSQPKPGQKPDERGGTRKPNDRPGESNPRR